jgi:hypothetical protein
MLNLLITAPLKTGQVWSQDGTCYGVRRFRKTLFGRAQVQVQSGFFMGFAYFGSAPLVLNGRTRWVSTDKFMATFTHVPNVTTVDLHSEC